MPGRLLIAGANGWLGRALRAAGERREWDVVGLARTTSEFVDAIAANPSEMARAVATSSPSLVVNCIGTSAGDVTQMRLANVDVVRALLESTEQVGGRLVHIGSAAEFGDPRTADPLPEEYPLRPTSDYGRTKAEGSMAVIEATSDAVVARLFNIAGPNPPNLSFLADLVTKVCAAEDSVLLGNADMVRDWVSIDLAVEAIFALGALQPDARVVHVCSGLGISHGELAAALGRCLGRRLSIHSEGLPGVRSVIGDAGLLGALTGLSSTMNANDLAKCILRPVGNTDIAP